MKSVLLHVMCSLCCLHDVWNHTWTLRMQAQQTCLSSLIVISLPLSGGVVESMEKGDFFNEKLTKSILFSSVHDAVLYCQQGNSEEVQDILISQWQRFPNRIQTCADSECWWPRQYFEINMLLAFLLLQVLQGTHL